MKTSNRILRIAAFSLLLLGGTMGYFSWQWYRNTSSALLMSGPVVLKQGTAKSASDTKAAEQNTPKPTAPKLPTFDKDGIIPSYPNQDPPPGYYSKFQPDGTIRFVKKMVAKSPTKRVYPVEKKVYPGKEMRLFFKKLGLVYTPVLLFSQKCQALQKLSLNSFSGYAEHKDYYDQLTSIYGRILDLGATYEPPVYVKWVNDKVGYGTFAARDIKKGEYVVEYTGLIVPENKTTVWSWRYPINGTFAGYSRSFSLDATDIGNEARFVNHSRENNVSVLMVFAKQQGSFHVIYYATRALKKDQEVLANYGTRYFRRREEIPLK
ncbi:MAG: SET domain-containing protein-lysine N-methyltransferase [Bacteroidota bacterium]